MTKGKPTQSGIYWVKMYKWNEKTLKYDLEAKEWEIAEVDMTESERYAVQVIGSDEGDALDRIYEYIRIDKPNK